MGLTLGAGAARFLVGLGFSSSEPELSEFETNSCERETFLAILSLGLIDRVWRSFGSAVSGEKEGKSDFKRFASFLSPRPVCSKCRSS